MRMPRTCQRRGKRPVVRVILNVKLLQQAANRRILQKDQFLIADHHLLMPIAHLISEVRPLLRRAWVYDIYRLDFFPNLDYRLLRNENHAVAGFEDYSGWKRDSKLNATVGTSPSVPPTPVIPGQCERVVPVTCAVWTEVGSTLYLLYNRHKSRALPSNLSKEEISLCEREYLGRLTVQQLAVSAHFIVLGIYFYLGKRIVQAQICFAQRATAAHGNQAPR